MRGEALTRTLSVNRDRVTKALRVFSAWILVSWLWSSRQEATSSMCSGLQVGFWRETRPGWDGIEIG